MKKGIPVKQHSSARITSPLLLSSNSNTKKSILIMTMRAFSKM